VTSQAPAAIRRALQLAGSCGQATGLGLEPRLSIGTLQLSIRCSSVHFGPSRSLPVSVAGMSADDAALGALGVTCRVRRSCADAGSAQATASSEISSDRWIAFMDRSVECGGEADTAGALSRSDSIEIHPATRNPFACVRPILLTQHGIPETGEPNPRCIAQVQGASCVKRQAVLPLNLARCRAQPLWEASNDLENTENC
jgi:hypothetical protein